MVPILEHLQQYVPMNTTRESIAILGQESLAEREVDTLHHIALGNLVNNFSPMYMYLPVHILKPGGDQLTAARARSSKRICSNSTRGKGKRQIRGFGASV